MIPVKGYIGLYRDENSNAIINKDDNSYNEYINSKNKLIQSQKRIENLEKEIGEIRDLLNKMLENK